MIVKKHNLPKKEPFISFEDKTYWCTLSFHEKHVGEPKGATGDGIHFKEHHRLFDEVYEYQEVSLL